MRFRGHETFAIRKGWLNKGIQNVIQNPGVFLGDAGNPMDVLGIGANMVKAMRYWLLAAQLTTEPVSGHRIQTLSDIGQLIYDNDPYFEEIGSLCLVHYLLATNDDYATAYYVFFNEFEQLEFTEEDFCKAVRKYVTMIDFEKLPSDRVVSDDFKCIINSYVSRNRINPEKINPEDNIECPLTELGLLDIVTVIKGERVYKKCNPKVENIPELIALAIIIKCADVNDEVKITSIQKDRNSLGKLFNLDTISLINILYKLDSLNYLKVIRTAGLDVIRINTDLTFEECIERYYDTLN